MVQAKHPFIQHIYATYKDNNCLYMLFEFIQGGTLARLIYDKGGSLSIYSTKFYAASIVSVFESLHGMNILYRDLKPENLMVQNDGFLRFVDFGFSKQLTSGTTMTMCGTPEYFAPEIVLGKSYHQSVDYWALGVLIYELLSGETPFYSNSLHDVLVSNKNILRGYFDFPIAINDCKI